MGGVAPGPKPLRAALMNIRRLLDRCVSNELKQLRPIDVFDIVMHSSNAVLAGGVRRSAVLTMFSPDDAEMCTAKTGSWFIDNPQRARSNNSALLVRDETTKEEFDALIASTREWGEPGFIWADDREMLYNPCVEIGLRAYDDQGRSGVEFCNLSEINMAAVNDRDDFYDACHIASILGTLQAGYTDLGYLGAITEDIVRREALIGVSATGFMDVPSISLDPAVQRCGAEIVKTTNKTVAELIGINPAARTTCVKPAGSTSCILGTASGIHPHHASRYFRRVQVHKLDPALEFFAKFNPTAVAESQWSSGKTDSVITFCCTVSPGALTKVDLPAIELLELVKRTQMNWVEYGTNKTLCTDPRLRHNVSNTVTVNPREWDNLADYIYDNRAYFAGISLLSSSGDKDYVQAPFQRVFTPIEIIEMYGDASLFASGLIVHAAQAFSDDLYAACSCFLGVGETLEDLVEASSDHTVAELQLNVNKQVWLARAEKFAARYFQGNRRMMTYCLKDVDAWKTWCDLERTTVAVPWDEFTEHRDNTRTGSDSACTGGACELVKI